MFVNLKQAFSLVEVAIIMSLIAIFITNNHIIVAKLDAASKFENQIDELQNISNQIRAYYYSNKVLPCPAPLAKDIYDKKSLLAAKFNNECLNMFGVFESKNEEFYMGAVPTYDLNLPSQNLTDIWGSKYFYIVKKELVTNEKLLISEDLLKHNLKDLIWFKKKSISSEENKWFSESYINHVEIINDFQLPLALKYKFPSKIQKLVLNVIHQDMGEMKFKIESKELIFKQENSKCYLLLKQNNIWEEIYSEKCLSHSVFSFKYNLFLDSVELLINNKIIYDLIVNLKETSIEINLTNNQIDITDILSVKEDKYAFIEKFFLNEHTVYNDVKILNHDGELLDFSFFLISNHNNRHHSYNSFGNVLQKGFVRETVMEFKENFSEKEFFFNCKNILKPCLVIGKDFDYIVNIVNLF